MNRKKFENVKIIASPHRFPMGEYVKRGYNVESPFRGASFAARAARFAWFRCNLPLKKRWFRDIDFEGIDLALVHEWIFGAEYLRWLRGENPDLRIAYLYSNKIASAGELDEIRSLGCEIWSWDKDDCESYEIGFIPTGGYPYEAENILRDDYQNYSQSASFATHGNASSGGDAAYDVYYIGRDKGRAENILRIKAALDGMGLVTNFHITADIFYKRFSKKYYKPPIPYESVVSDVKKSKAILHLCYGAQRGITLRVSESIIFGVKLITDDVSIRDYDFYNEDNIYILSGDNLQGIPEFLSRPYAPLPENVRRFYTADGMIEGIIRGGF